MASEATDLLTPAEFATMARVTVAAVRKWAARGVGPQPKRPPGSSLVRYERAEVEAWLRGEPIGAGVAQ